MRNPSDPPPRRGCADLNPTLGHEQHGVRPCVVISDPDVIASQRFAVVCVVPITSTPGGGLLYPMLESVALNDHLRSIDKRTTRRVFGEIGREEIAIDEGLTVFLGLGGHPGEPEPPVR